MPPFSQTSIIEHLQIIGNNEWNDIIGQTLLEHELSTNTAITNLERMNLFKAYMEIKNIPE